MFVELCGLEINFDDFFLKKAEKALKCDHKVFFG